MHTTCSTVIIIIIIIFFLNPGTQFPRKEKITLCNMKKYKNQAGMNLTPPPPSQNIKGIYIAQVRKGHKCAVIVVDDGIGIHIKLSQITYYQCDWSAWKH